MYLGVLTTIAGWIMLYPCASCIIYGLVLAVGFHLFIVLYEEPHLARRFGGDYAEYRARVGRWFPRRTTHSTDGDGHRR